ncbi:MAG: AEC family transporter [Halioglobus sp.]
MLATALAVSLPTFGWVILGLTLRRIGLLRDDWVEVFSRLSFNYGLPVLLFAGAARVDYGAAASARYLLAGIIATFLVSVGSWAYSVLRHHPQAYRGLFVQAAFRSNLAIVGLALSVSAYGERGAVLAALPIAVLTLLYNVIAVWVLNTTLGAQTSLLSLTLGIVRNPLILGISAGVLVAVVPVSVPESIFELSAVLSTLLLPMMLVCVGASMRFSALSAGRVLVTEAVVWRLLVAPALLLGVCLALGVTGESLGVIFLLLSSPVATASFVMVIAARGDGTLAANMIVTTTLASVVTVTLGFLVLLYFGLAGQPV